MDPTTTPPPHLRPYQTAAIAAVVARWARGQLRQCVALPTGAGKTVVATPLLALARPGRALALVHTRTLLEQTRRRIPFARCETIQAVLARGRPLHDVDVVFVDECHHTPSSTWSRVLTLLPPGARLVGCTATPTRADGTALGTCFDGIVTTATYTELLAGGYLAPCRVLRPPTALAPAAAYLAHGAGRPGVIFAPTVAACEGAVQALQLAGVRAAVICGTTPDRERARAFTAYEAGRLDVLASPMALSEGFDSPRAAVCVLDRQCEHVGVYLQTAGRVLRPHPTKTAAHPAVLVDLRGASVRHGSPLDDRTYHLEGAPIRRATAPGAAPRRVVWARPPAQLAGVAAGRAARSFLLKVGRALSFLWA